MIGGTVYDTEGFGYHYTIPGHVSERGKRAWTRGFSAYVRAPVAKRTVDYMLLLQASYYTRTFERNLFLAGWDAAKATTPVKRGA